MDSTPIGAATTATTCTPAVVDALALRVAAEAPAALAVAFEGRLSQETSVLRGLAGGAAGGVAPSSSPTGEAAPAMSYRSRHQGSPPRGTPV